jgi:hypothetical protein
LAESLGFCLKKDVHCHVVPKGSVASPRTPLIAGASRWCRDRDRPRRAPRAADEFFVPDGVHSNAVPGELVTHRDSGAARLAMDYQAAAGGTTPDAVVDSRRGSRTDLRGAAIVREALAANRA